jgi:hypothetical protein
MGEMFMNSEQIIWMERVVISFKVGLLPRHSPGKTEKYHLIQQIARLKFEAGTSNIQVLSCSISDAPKFSAAGSRLNYSSA